MHEARSVSRAVRKRLPSRCASNLTTTTTVSEVEGEEEEAGGAET